MLQIFFQIVTLSKTYFTSVHDYIVRKGGGIAKDSKTHIHLPKGNLKTHRDIPLTETNYTIDNITYYVLVQTLPQVQLVITKWTSP